jgi:SAM-dependent methyltransferase
MFTKSASFYDALYHFKDYGAASSKLHDMIQRRKPGANTLLDVGCGTGKHLQALSTWYRVEGLDLNDELLDVARERCPAVPLHCADMTEFNLGARFDVVCCLFSAIAYVRTPDRMRAAVRRMASHLEPGGLLIIEPWFSSERLWTDRITTNFVDQPDLKISWMYTTRVEDDISMLDIHYLVGTPDGVNHFTERHELGLFSKQDYNQALMDAGLSSEHDPAGLFDRGLYIGTAPQTAG